MHSLGSSIIPDTNTRAHSENKTWFCTEKPEIHSDNLGGAEVSHLSFRAGSARVHVHSVSVVQENIVASIIFVFFVNSCTSQTHEGICGLLCHVFNIKCWHSAFLLYVAIIFQCNAAWCCMQEAT